MEVIKGYVSEVKFPVPSSAATFTVTGEDDTDYTPSVTNATVSGGVAVVSIPYSAMTKEQTLTVEIQFEEGGEEYSLSKHVYVITPILEKHEVVEVLGGTPTDKEIIDAEAAARHIIYAHTGQSFGKHTATYTIRGTGASTLALPYRLITPLSFNGIDHLPGNYALTGDGWYLAGGIWGVPNIKADYYGFHQVNGVIHNPNGISRGHFLGNQEYAVRGIWGWEEVPAAIKEAAKLLIADYACDDSVYRDRYIDAVSAVDWRIQFNTGAFAQTGNVRADQLLSNYVLKRGWAVL